MTAPSTAPTPTPAAWLDLAPDHPFGLATLPYTSFATTHDAHRRLGIGIGDRILDLTAATAALLPDDAALFADGTLDRLLAAGPGAWSRTRAAVTSWLTEGHHRRTIEPLLVPVTEAVLRLPFTVADYVDFYASEHHATNLGRILRPGTEPLTPNWKHLPIGYHGRAGTVIVSGSPVTRPRGQRREPDGRVVVGPSTRLDIEAELGVVVGHASVRGVPVPTSAFADHAFGVCLVNDWSARDIQAFEYVPLGPFGAKSFATSVSPWIVPLAALEHARVAPPPRDPRPAPYLDDADLEPWGLDIELEIALNSHVVARPPVASMYWTGAQQLAHLTLTGASLRAGDLLASGTVSGPEPHQRGSLIELTWNGETPLRLPDGSTRTFLEDGDEVVITGSAPGPAGTRIGFGEVRGRIVPAGDPS